MAGAGDRNGRRCSTLGQLFLGAKHHEGQRLDSDAQHPVSVADPGEVGVAHALETRGLVHGRNGRRTRCAAVGVEHHQVLAIFTHLDAREGKHGVAGVARELRATAQGPYVLAQRSQLADATIQRVSLVEVVRSGRAIRAELPVLHGVGILGHLRREHVLARRFGRDIAAGAHARETLLVTVVHDRNAACGEHQRVPERAAPDELRLGRAGIVSHQERTQTPDVVIAHECR